MPLTNQVYRVLIPSLGFRSRSLAFRPEKRVAGKSKYSFRKMLRLAVDSAMANNQSLFRRMLKISLFMIGISIAYIGYVLFSWLQGETEPGWASIVSVIFFMGNIQIFLLLFLSFSLNRIRDTILAIPPYIVEEAVVTKPTPSKE
jgi:dolichol-phosphate mannosyltransferase